MKKTVHQLLILLMLLIMIFDAVPVKAIAEGLPTDNDKIETEIIQSEAEPLPEKAEQLLAVDVSAPRKLFEDGVEVFARADKPIALKEQVGEVSISIEIGKEANIPETAVLLARAAQDAKSTDEIQQLVRSALDGQKAMLSAEDGAVAPETEESIRVLGVYDLSITDGETKCQPDSPVTVTVELEEDISDGCRVYALHFCDDGSTELIPAEANGRKVVFPVSGFSLFALVMVEEVPSRTEYTAEIDLSSLRKEGEAYSDPFSLAELLDLAEKEGKTEQVVLKDAAEVETEYDDVLTLEGDSLVPTTHFDAARFTYAAGDGTVYYLTLTNWNPLMNGKQTVAVEDAKYTLSINVTEAAQISAYARFEANAVVDETYSQAAKEKVTPIENTESEIEVLALFDLTVYDGDQVVKPAAGLRIGVSFGEKPDEDMKLYAVHFPGTGAQPAEHPAAALNTNGTKKIAAPLKNAAPMRSTSAAPASEIIEVETEDNEIVFNAGSFSYYAIVGITIEKYILASDGHNYRISVTFTPDAGIPETAELEVSELTDGASAYGILYKDYVANAESALGMTDGSAEYIRLFDISIVDRDDPSIKYQPTEDSVVNVRIELADSEDGNLTVVHFAEGAETPEVVVEAMISDDEESGQIVEFQTDGFSVYAIVDQYVLPTAVEIAQLTENMFYLSIDSDNARYYFKGQKNNSYIARTNLSDIDAAALYGFEPVEGTVNQFYLYTYRDTGEKQYISMNKGTPSFSETSGSPFVVEKNVSVKEYDAFYIYSLGSDSKKYALTYNSSGFNGKVGNPQANNAIVLTLPISSDAFGFNGKSFGILNNQDTVSGTALNSVSSNNDTRLQGQTMTVRIEPIKRTENVFVANNSQITMWSFRSISGDKYHITAEVGGNLKYLSISDSTVKLMDEPDSTCVITVEAGTGKYSGKYKFSCNGSALHLNGSTFDRVNDLTTKNDANCWMNLAELSNLKDDDFVVYTATKVSVSGTENEFGVIDYDVEDGDQVIIYTRIWNESTLRYDYYAIDYDGMLVKAYESGDTISWVGSKANTMLWNFTEYLDNDTGLPSNYYELQNAYSGKYLAPQVSNTVCLANQPIGINMTGRRDGEYNTTILAWDDPYYDYASLKAVDYQLISAPIAQADTFYFAVMKPKPAESEIDLTTVATVNSQPYGITLRMQDYGNVQSSDNRSKDQTDVIQNTDYIQWKGVKNLMSKYIPEGASYPFSTLTESSLGNLYSNAMDVNHLFLLSTHQETGYFEYDSTQNFAHLITSAADPWNGVISPNGTPYGIGDFVIYNQIASTNESLTNVTRHHGQFFPYNDLVKNDFIVGMVNDTDIAGKPLSSLDPKKGEKLYRLKYDKNKVNSDPAYVNYFFGMEMNANFIQSASGLDAWGHDLIFEFSGDDDFWLYIDDALVLDLGGIHSALSGSVNFRTGKVIENGTVSNLRERFKTAYKAQYPEKSDSEVDEWLNGIFKDDGSNTGTVFKDYSGHTMRMYYMERGAGASNLHMRFNLAQYIDGEVQLEKKVTGTDTVDTDTVFPFQIRYHDSSAPEGYYQYVDNNNSVTDVRTGEAIPFKASYTVNGVTYENVFLLRADQTVSVRLPRENTMYFITECGMDTTVYDSVKANDATLEGKPTSVSAIQDFQIQPATVASRKKVIYTNHVSDDAMHSLFITKKVWREFSKETEITDDTTLFRFRIYIDKDQNGNYIVYSTGKYRVKDPEGYYCVYNHGFQPTEKKVFSELNPNRVQGALKSEQEQATFTTSPSGQADKIPAGYTIEIPGLMAGTAFMVVEREAEIPEGYHLIDYTTANEGTINDQDEHVIVNNQHGYGLTANKVWSDTAFMEDHDEIYFAVYLKDSDNFILQRNTVRQLSKTGTSVRWFFPELAQGKTLNDYHVYEVKLEDGKFTVDSNTNAVSLEEGYEPERIEGGETLTVGGKSNEHGYSANYTYTAVYTRKFLTQQEIENNVNSRTDIVTNTRPGIKLVKTDLEGIGLEGAKFTLEKKNDSGSSKKSFTSDENGLIAVAYLTTNEEYILTETAAPYRYRSLIDSIAIKVGSDGLLYVNENPIDGLYYTVSQVPNPTADEMPTVKIQNMPFTLTAKKIDAVSHTPIAGIRFELYREILDYEQNRMPDYAPMEGFGGLVTAADGIIPKINLEELGIGSYYLREKETTTQYIKLDYDIRLTILETGQIIMQKAMYSDATKKWEFVDFTDNVNQVRADENGNVMVYIANEPAKGVRILKKSNENAVLADAEFTLYRMDQVSDNHPKENAIPLLEGKTNSEGILNLGALGTNTTYYLFETKAPTGYMPNADPVIITTMSQGALKATLGGVTLDSATIADSDNTELIQITVYNSAGIELPATGGPGIFLTTSAGCALLLLTLIELLKRLRSNKE